MDGLVGGKRHIADFNAGRWRSVRTDSDRQPHCPRVWAGRKLDEKRCAVCLRKPRTIMRFWFRERAGLDRNGLELCLQRTSGYATTGEW